MAQLAGVGGQDCDEALVESGSYQVTAHPASSLVNATTRGRHVNARAPAGPVISKGQTPDGGAVTMLAVVARPDGTDRGPDASVGEALAVGQRQVLAAVVVMRHESGENLTGRLQAT
jgi:hypothetical protein